MNRTEAITKSGRKYNIQKVYTGKKSSSIESNINNLLHEVLESEVPLYENPELLKKLVHRGSINELPEEIYDTVKDVVEYLNSINNKTNVEFA